MRGTAARGARVPPGAAADAPREEHERLWQQRLRRQQLGGRAAAGPVEAGAAHGPSVPRPSASLPTAASRGVGRDAHMAWAARSVSCAGLDGICCTRAPSVAVAGAVSTAAHVPPSLGASAAAPGGTRALPAAVPRSLAVQTCGSGF